MDYAGLQFKGLFNYFCLENEVHTFVPAEFRNELARCTIVSNSTYFHCMRDIFKSFSAEIIVT